jgi:hypothetical protein
MVNKKYPQYAGIEMLAASVKRKQKKANNLYINLKKQQISIFLIKMFSYN